MRGMNETESIFFFNVWGNRKIVVNMRAALISEKKPRYYVDYDDKLKRSIK